MRLALCVAAALVAALAGCGGSGGAAAGERVSLMLDFFPNADHAGIYAAQAGGHFSDEGVRVSIRTPSDPAAPLKLLAAGKVDLAITYEPELLLARDQNLPVVSVAALVQQPLTSIVSIGAKLGRHVARNIVPLLIAIAIFVMVGVLRWPMIPVVLIATPLSILLAYYAGVQRHVG